MKRFFALVLIAAMGILTIGCASKTDYKLEKKTSQTKDAKTTGDTKTTAAPPAPDGGSTPNKKTTETTKQRLPGRAG